MTSKNFYVQCRISKEEKEEWKKFARDHNFSSVSEFVRFSVNDIIEKKLKRTLKDATSENTKPGTKNTYIRVRITEETKQKWDNFIEEMNFPTFSELMRFSVYTIINNELHKQIQQNNRMFLLYRNNQYYQEELNKLIEVPSCKGCGLKGLVWWNEEGLCLECAIKKNCELQEKMKETKRNDLKHVIIQIPASLINEINKQLEKNNTLAYRSYTEFIIDAARHRLEDIKGLKL